MLCDRLDYYVYSKCSAVRLGNKDCAIYSFHYMSSEINIEQTTNGRI